MASPVLWQNESKTTILIDIPRSIEAAQGTPDAPCHDHLLSVTPLETPFPSNEPKSEATRAKLVGNPTDQQLDREYVELLSNALAETHQAYHGRWCRPRPFVQEKPRVAKKRKLDTDEPSDSIRPIPTHEELPEDLLRTLADGDYSPDSSDYKMTLHPTQGSPDHDTTSTTQYTTNRTSRPATLNISTPTHRQPYTFVLPPHSTFSLTNCCHSTPFRNSLRAQASLSEPPTRRTFDVVLLDPPWPNRSIKRSHRTPGGSNYSVPANLETLTDLLHSMDLDMLMSPSCIVGVWITNKPSIRETMLHPEEGVFATWGVELVEEWIWVKTTAKGEPVSGLEGVWRKPYEVLLVGRRGGDETPASSADGGLERRGGGGGKGGGREVKRRVILGVSDLHSRKPCLKGLVEEILLRDHHHQHHDDGRTGYRALEVFARNLVAGWWSWGDECVKFNWEGYWQREELTG
ncbi:hypothetical protein D0867_00811 [Hortaea werneckii]|uniref:MT-A70-domain-containing protein n=1 Tax=Hortaea werneckii TaxID=91943 RepID=A0A3M7ACY6_HORWE|nr:hypothetical protein D0867_00811 [Hortaea werneckii]RMY34407.1 hypothetical protein D0866_05272 [Hortaea werneckii]